MSDNIKNIKLIILMGASALLMILIMIWANTNICTDYILVDGTIHIVQNQQYVSTDLMSMGGGDYKLPARLENLFEDSEKVTCRLNMTKIPFSDSTYYELVDINNSRLFENCLTN